MINFFCKALIISIFVCLSAQGTIIVEAGTPISFYRELRHQLEGTPVNSDLVEVSSKELEKKTLRSYVPKGAARTFVNQFATFDDALDSDYYIEPTKPDTIAGIVQNVNDDVIVTNSRTFVEILAGAGIYSTKTPSVIWITDRPAGARDLQLSNRVSKTIVMGDWAYKSWMDAGADPKSVVKHDPYVLAKTVRETDLNRENVRSERFGKFMGIEVAGSEHALSNLNKEYPSDFEVLVGHQSLDILPRVSFKRPFRFSMRSPNPYGHIAVRIRNTVYTIDFEAIPGANPFHIKTTLLDYFYSVLPTDNPKYDFVGMNGQAYGRESFGLRVSGLSEKELDAMEAKFEEFERDFSAGKLKYNFCTTNCAEFDLRVIQATGRKVNRGSLIAFPGRILDEVAKMSQRDGLKTSLVRYGYVQGAYSGWRRGGPAMHGLTVPFKLILINMLRAIGFHFNAKFSTPDAQVFFSPQQNRLVYENLERLHSPVKQCLGFYR